MYEYIHTYDSIYAYMHWRNVRCHDCARTHEKSGKWAVGQYLASAESRGVVGEVTKRFFWHKQK